MDEATFLLVEKLADSAIAALYREVARAKTSQLKFHIEVEVNELRELLAKARHTQKGGAHHAER